MVLLGDGRRNQPGQIDEREQIGVFAAIVDTPSAIKTARVLRMTGNRARRLVNSLIKLVLYNRCRRFAIGR